MSNYVKSTNFYAKDALVSGNPDKIIKGAEIDDEYNNIATAVSTKADLNSPTFTGIPLAPTAPANTNTTQLATTAFVTSVVNTLGTMSTQNKIAVDITGGTVVGITDLAVADGGTGVSTLAANAVVLGNGTNAVQTVAPGTSGNLLTSNGTTWVSSPPAFIWNVVDVNTNTNSYSIPANAILVTGTCIHYMGGNVGSRMSVRVKNSGGSTLYTYDLTGGNEYNGGDGGSGMHVRSAWSVLIPSAAIGGTLEFFQSSGSGSGFTNTVNQVVKSA